MDHDFAGVLFLCPASGILQDFFVCHGPILYFILQYLRLNCF